MKKIFYILLLYLSFGYAQKTALPGDAVNYQYTEIVSFKDQFLKREDFKLSNGRMLVLAMPCKFNNDHNTNTILISVICQQTAFNELGIEKINDMIRVANEKIRKTFQFNHSYQTKEIKIAYMPDSHDWSLTGSFTVQEGDGVVKERLLAMDFDSNGTFEVMKRIL